MKGKGFLLKPVCLVAVWLILSSCSPSTSQRSLNAPEAVGSSPPKIEQRVSSADTSATPNATSAIRMVDFSQIVYSNLPDYGRSKRDQGTLKPGRAKPVHIGFGDISGDGIEDAMVVLAVEVRGSAIPYHVYIFKMENGKPKLIWDFETGDRADGGLRQVYADNGQLVVELFGKDRVIGGDLYKGDEALCCPSSFTRTRYKWTGKDFSQISQEVLENSERTASPVISSYHSVN